MNLNLKNNQKKLFIVLEGIDGAGTSTQSELLKKALIAQGDKAVISPEPSSGIIGNLIRQALKKRILFTEDADLFDEQMAYLFASDRHDHLYNDIDGVFKLIQEGFHIISTRYYFSSLAYNCQTPEQFDFISKLNHKFPNPDLVIYLDLPVEISLARIKERSLKEVYENQAKLTRVSQNYQTVFQEYADPLLIIDATETPDLIHQQILNFIHNQFY
ncbi:MAG TPA: dTMP kinase [Xenococcaceae cyanobacterium]